MLTMAKIYEGEGTEYNPISCAYGRRLCELVAQAENRYPAEGV